MLLYVLILETGICAETTARSVALNGSNSQRKKVLTMDDLIHFVSDASWAMFVTLAVIGAIALVSYIGIILYSDFKDMNDTEPPKGE